jgi:hypothetical protein
VEESPPCASPVTNAPLLGLIAAFASRWEWNLGDSCPSPAPARFVAALPGRARRCCSNPRADYAVVDVLGGDYAASSPTRLVEGRQRRGGRAARTFWSPRSGAHPDRGPGGSRWVQPPPVRRQAPTAAPVHARAASPSTRSAGGSRPAPVRCGDFFTTVRPTHRPGRDRGDVRAAGHRRVVPGPVQTVRRASAASSTSGAARAALRGRDLEWAATGRSPARAPPPPLRGRAEIASSSVGHAEHPAVLRGPRRTGRVR